MSSEQFQSAHESIHQIGTRLLEYLREIRAERRSEDDETKGLQSVEDDIVNALNVLKEQKYQVAVIAAMKAGKSTFLNALIGSDILASESEACTVCRTDIRPIKDGATPKLLEYREGKRKPVVIAEGEAKLIREKFLERTHEIRATKNRDKSVRFELEHSIEAISKIPALAGFTLVDTPGPNEWESADFNTLELKKNALEALRTCDAILFILDYSSFKDNTNSELLQELLEQRKETLQENTGKLYFILNKIDRKSRKDRSIDSVIQDLQKSLKGFGINNPIIYPASAGQGLLAKLIQKKVAEKNHQEDFKDFYFSRYIEVSEDGKMLAPNMFDIVPQALIDSNIPMIEESVIQTVVQNSGWNLLSDVLSKLDKSAKAIENFLTAKIRGWDIALEELKNKLSDFQKHSHLSEKKVSEVKTSVDQQKEILIKGFGEGIREFATIAKANIKEEIEKLVEARKEQLGERQKSLPSGGLGGREINIGQIFWGIISPIAETIGNAVLEFIPNSGVRNLIFKFSRSLLDMLHATDLDLKGDETQNKNFALEQNFYQIKYNSSYKAKKLLDTINSFCTPHIQSWWLKTQHELINHGATVRNVLTQKIKTDIQAISDDLSQLIQETLQVELNNNPIQFPDFEFSGIDNLIKTRQKVINRTRKEKRGFSFMEHYVDVPYQVGTQNEYIIDLHEVENSINKKIDNQVSGSNQLLKDIIEKQIEKDFQSAKQQINDYINRFQDTFDSLIKERERQEAAKERICAVLETQKNKLEPYLNELISVKTSLDSWKPSKK